MMVSVKLYPRRAIKAGLAWEAIHNSLEALTIPGGLRASPVTGAEEDLVNFKLLGFWAEPPGATSTISHSPYPCVLATWLFIPFSGFFCCPETLKLG